jgi:hypothetical protein
MDRTKSFATAKSAARRRHANGRPRHEECSVNQTELQYRLRALQLAWDQSPIPGRHRAHRNTNVRQRLELVTEPLLVSVEERLGSREAEGRHQLRMVMREQGGVPAVARSPRDGGDLDGRDCGSESDLLVRVRIVGRR